VHAAQAVMACGVGPAADTPCMTMQGADTATRSVATDWSAVETVREQALASTRAHESANRALREELAALLVRDADLRESLLAAEHDRDALGRKVAELEGALLVAKKLQDLPPHPPPCERCAIEVPRLQALVGGAEHVELLRLREAVADAQKRGDRLEREARELTTEMKATVARAQAARKADADTISRQETELARLRGCAGDAQEKVREALREAAGARQALSAAAAAPATSREGIIALLYAQIADLEKARAAADERAARAEARDAASRARLESLRAWASEECEPDPRDTPARRPK
jgi:chromosome segregation ATPase